MESDIITCPHCATRNRVPAAATGRPRCAHCHQWLPWIATAGDADFSDVAEQASVPVLVDLWATWCGPCRMVSPALEQLARERAGRLKLVKVDVDQAPQTSQRFSVQAVPTLLLLEHGHVLKRQSGAASIAALRNWLDETLTTKEDKEART
ncbi:thiol reductase thioredoxin [Mycolicibacterium madagascariense]|uniref:Thioredoxin n=1 Tax=Mycolicibacterium madagascariense TaxID=212765 RepID=A0A7I7X9B3_9MYCO|nr:thioredoxin [Mycolicibacterium madagascariense]MCV7013416.1 thioredoxin [Mycolicibacterium madagascariense]BBZ25865.1 thiol reductase thioredoxin [Mycolicibacterium madagascariense]